jgi:molybdopterin synthase catalytic subunit
VDGDEVAFIPPVSGGATAVQLIELTTQSVDVRRTEAAVAHPGAGAICSFTGVVRDNNRGEAVTHLEYEAYGGMAERQMRRIAEEVADRWPGTRVAMVHRAGRLEIGEVSVAISVSAPRRGDAFEACRHAIERLKESVPIWKKEFARSGAVWLEGPEARPARCRGEACLALGTGYPWPGSLDSGLACLGLDRDVTWWRPLGREGGCHGLREHRRIAACAPSEGCGGGGAP